MTDGSVVVGVMVIVAGCLSPWNTAGAVVVATAALVGRSGLSLLGGHAINPRVVVRWSVTIVLAVTVTGAWADRAKAGLSSPSRAFEATSAVVRSDAEPSLGGDRAEVSIDGHRWLMTVPRNTVGRPLTVGDRLVVSGSTVAIVKRSAFHDARHLAGRFRLRRILARQPPMLPFRLANGVRSTVLRSASGFSREQHTLFAGFVLGDVSDARPELTDDFRASGLSHLVVVSGQNLAFLLAGLQPVLSRVGRRSRLVPAASRLIVVVAFVFVARFEPSVLRAAVMAAVIIVTRAVGRPQPLLRVLAVAVGVLLLVDPLLVRSIGFALSVGAVGGIAVFGERFTVRLHSLGRLAGPVAITLAAQLGTAPVLLSSFDGVPVVSLPANLIALPLAAPVMSWGVVAGIPAGLAGRTASTIVQIPTRLLLTAVAAVAKWSARLPLGSFGLVDVVIVAGAVLIAVGLAQLRQQRRRPTDEARVRRLLVLSVVGVLLIPSLRALSPWGALPPGFAAGRTVLAPATTAVGWSGPAVARRVDVLVVGHGASTAMVLRRLRATNIVAIDAVVVVSGGRPQKALLGALHHRVGIGVVISPPAVGAPPGVSWKQARPGLVMITPSVVIHIDEVRGNRVVARVELRPPRVAG